MKRLVTELTLACTMLALLALGAFHAPAAQAADAKPVVVVSLAGYDALRQDLGYIGGLSGAPKLPEMAEGFLAAVTQGNGLAGLDKKKPIGAAVFYAGEGRPSGYVFIPIEDADKLLESLRNFVVDLEDQGDGYSTFKLKKGQTLTLRETKGWAFVSLNKELLADVPADPAALLGDLPKAYDAAVKFNIGALPPELIDLAIAQMRVGAAQAMEKSPVQDDEQAEALSKAITESTLKQIEQGLKDLDAYTIGLAIDGTAHSLYLDVQVEMKDGSELAGKLNDAVKSAKPSTLPAFADAARIFNLHINSPVAGDDAKNAVKLLEQGRKIGAAKIEEEGDDEAARKLQKKLLDAVIDVAVATVEGGQINGGAVVSGEGPYSLVAGFHVVDAKKLEKVLKEVVEVVSNDPNAPEFEIDADTKSGITYHTIALPEIDDEEKAENAEKFFGTDELTLAIGFGEKKIIIALGDDPIVAADEVVNAKTAKLPAKELPLQMQLKLGPPLKMAAENAENPQPVLKLLVDALAAGDKDHVSLTALLIKNGERVRFEVEEGILAAFGKAVVAASQGAR